MQKSGTDSARRRYPKISFGLSWIAIIPGSIWIIETYYLPVFGGKLNPEQSLLAAPVILLFVAFSLLCHLVAHVGAGRSLGIVIPATLTLLIFGDVSQSWPQTRSPRSDFLVAAAGPLANLVLAVIAYLVWDAQLNDFVGNMALLLCGFNAWLFIINLIPAFPIDGGRMIRAASAGLFGAVGASNRYFRILGVVIATAMAGWALLLVEQRARFSAETAQITLLLVILLFEGLWTRPVDGSDFPAEGARPRTRRASLAQALAVGSLFLCLAAGSLALLLTNNGLDAPGVSLPIESMVQVPPQYHHAHSGSFYLVTVISSAPITAGEWLLGHVDPAIAIVPPEVVVPKDTTPQEQAKQGFQMLDDSETTAIAVGLELAGYKDTAVGKGVEVVGILPGSHAQGLLQPGDVITRLDGHPVATTSDLIAMVKIHPSSAPVVLHVQRGQNELDVTVPLMAPASPTDGPKIGISIQSAGFDYTPPFPVSIVTQKISGGPSAGLMFTLTVYNALSVNDLAGGRKIAGTGTINLDGTVGPIGGVKQKIFAAEGVGAEYFLCPVDNYTDALSVAKSIKVIKIATVQEAVNFLESLPPSHP